MKNFKFAIAALLAGTTLGAHAAHAATQSVTANVTFDTPLSITKNSDINFGLVKAAQAGTYTIDTTGAVTASGGGVALGGTRAAGNLTIAGSTSQVVDISAGNYAANNGVTPANATCAYNGGSAAACSLTSQVAPGAGKVLLVGADVTASGAQTAGSTAAPTFDVVVNYH